MPLQPVPAKMSQRPLLIALALLVLTLVSGCGQLQFAYDHARWAMVPKLKKIADFNDTQRLAIEAEFDKYMAWHRKRMLPEYARLLRQAAGLLTEDVALAAIRAQRAAWLQAWEATIRPVNPPMAKVLVELNDAQLLSMQSNFAEEDADARKDLAKKSRDERLKQRDDKLLDLLDDWAGGLTDTQRMSLQPLVHKLPLREDAMLEDRKRMRADLLTRLRAHEAQANIEAVFQTWFIERRRTIDAQDGPLLDAFIHVANRTLSATQRAQVRQTLLGYAKDCEQLATAKL